MDRVRGLLTRWREKVYALLVQQKLQEIEDLRKKEESQRKVRQFACTARLAFDWLPTAGDVSDGEGGGGRERADDLVPRLSG